MRRGTKPGEAKVKARPSVARKPPKNETFGRRELEKRLTEALEQQTATAEILRVINRTQTDVQPLFDVIVENACRLCDGVFANVVRFDGELMHNMAHHGFSREAAEILTRAFPRRAARDSMAGRTILAGDVVHSEDASTDDDAAVSQQLSGLLGYRAQVSVPLLRDGVPVGAITVARRERGRFPESQIALLKTFADQAVIAIENARLFKELDARNRDLTATSEILRVISSSPTDVQPVFDTIVRSAVRLSGGLFGALFQFDGELLHLVAHHNYSPEALEEVRRVFPTQPTRAFGMGRAILERTVVLIPDVEVDLEYQQQALSRAIGWRSGVFVPMIRDGAPIGGIMVTRAKSGPFSGNEVELLQTFADQAVIAIENVRLFNETKEALEQQTATSEILRVISNSPTDRAKEIFKREGAQDISYTGESSVKTA